MTRAQWTVFVVVSVAITTACSSTTGPGKASQLVFEVDPVPVGLGAPFAPTVVVGVADDHGRLVTDWTGGITLSLEGGTGSGGLDGVVTRIPQNGLAAFDGLTVSVAGQGYTLVARSGGLPDARSTSFDVPDVFHSASVYAGEAHTCALDDQGQAWCWGLNDHGQLGDGTTDTRTIPTPSAAGLQFTALSLGARHTCGLTGTGTVYCWGQNGSGETGTGTTTDVLEPGAVALPGPAVQVDAGDTHTCALLQDSTAYCWGDNRYGELGTGSPDTTALTPQPVAGGVTFTSVSAGVYATCGLAAGGTAYCWGRNVWGEVGDSTQTERNLPTAVAGGRAFRQLGTGGEIHYDATCAVETGGQADCWGRINTADEPTPVPGDPGLDAVFVRGHYASGLTTGGTLYVWGSGQYGQFANGSTGLSDTPVPVLAEDSIVSVAVGWYHMCAVTGGGATWCWGSNASGQLGNASNAIGWLVPVPVWAPQG